MAGKEREFVVRVVMDVTLRANTRRDAQMLATEATLFRHLPAGISKITVVDSEITSDEAYREREAPLKTDGSQR